MDKKAAIREYKLSSRPMGIYQIRNTTNEKIWIDSSVNLPAKFNRYRLQLNAGTHVNKDLQADWKDLGESAFAFEILEPLEPRDDPNYDYAADLEVLEDLWLEKLTPYGDRGYNIPKRSTEERLRMIRENRSM
ncbi:MAG: GIY-YIG nuclease family protein [Acidobacteriota bacterium]